MKNRDRFQFFSEETPNSSDGWQADLLKLLFERMPMGIAILDREFRIHRYNPTWGDFSLRYAPSTGAPLTPGVGYFEHLPGTERIVLPLFQQALAGEVVRKNGIHLKTQGIESCWNVVLAPLTEGGETIGIINIAVDVTEQTRLRHDLEKRIEERTRELQVLLDVTAAANRSLDLIETLEATLDLIVALVGASRAGVLLLDESTGELIPYSLRPVRDVAPDDLAEMLSACRSVLDNRAALYVAPDLEESLAEPGALIPLESRGERLGVLVIIGAQGGAFSMAQLALFQSIADQLSVAIENARLFAKSEQAAIAAERNRLARDLHDAVTQTLFSSSMIAEVLPIIWERNPEEGRRRLEELRQLTRGALSEMRTLLVELRPAALTDTDLGELIGHQVNAFVARTRLQVAFEHDISYHPPVEVKEAFYRIAQEAFNNITRHAEAAQVQVRLNGKPGTMDLTIQDDGIGFDARTLAHEGLGLGIMRERARSIGARLEIVSRPGRGTRLHLNWQAPPEEKGL
ncbi:MAG TPA: histidine kinase [Anaerolineae bacterium]|nr:histidine kinase [Anaerolineae bacterium]HNU03965.1 histidine kinase [Anaerolineae bacterium]